jgi:GntR family transcriptional regulator
MGQRAPKLALHRRIKEQLERTLGAGSLMPGKRLPSESEIMQSFGVSRHVVRLALAELAKEGRIHTQRGRGSFVNPPKEIHPITSLTSYHKLMEEQNLQADIRVLRNRPISPTKATAIRLGLIDGQQIVELVRVGRTSGKPALLMVSYLPLSICKTLPTKDMRTTSLYEYLETECGLRLVYAENYIEVAFATREQAKYLEVSPGSTLLLIEGLVYDQGGLPVELSRVLYRGDRFKLFFESSKGESAPELKGRIGSACPRRAVSRLISRGRSRLGS